MSPSRTALLAVAASVALAACGQSPPADVVDGAAGAQQELIDRALSGLAARSCAPRPETTVLGGLPQATLDCLGAGPSRPVSAGDGRPTVVNLWASWCAPCVREMPLLEQISQQAGDAVVFVGVDTQDERASAAGLLDATGVTYEQRADPDGLVRNALRAPGLPVTVVFDAQGKEVTRRFGEIKGSWLRDALAAQGVVLAPTASPSPASGTG